VSFVCFCSGKFPFYTPNFDKMSANIITGNYKFPSDVAFSSEGKDVIKKLLVTASSQRLSATEVLQTSWVLRVSKNSI